MARHLHLEGVIIFSSWMTKSVCHMFHSRAWTLDGDKRHFALSFRNQISLNGSPPYGGTYFVNLIHALPSDPWQFVRIVYFGDPRCPILSSISSGNDIVRGPARNSTWTRADISDNEGDIFQDRDARIEKMRAGVTGGEKRQPEERMKRREEKREADKVWRNEEKARNRF